MAFKINFNKVSKWASYEELPVAYDIDYLCNNEISAVALKACELSEQGVPSEEIARQLPDPDTSKWLADVHQIWYVCVRCTESVDKDIRMNGFREKWHQWKDICNEMHNKLA